MSFFTSLHYYRPTAPPKIYSGDLVDFCERFARLDVANFTHPQGVQIKFGKGVVADRNPSSWFMPVSGLWESRSIRWDADARYTSPAELRELIGDEKRPIYLASIDLGSISAEVRNAVSRVNSPENAYDLTPDAWSLNIGPIEIYNMQTEAIRVGWIAVSLSGNGYLYPWTPAELVARLEGHAKIQAVMELCQQQWPVEPHAPTAKQMHARRRMEQLWPYPELNRALNWHWGVEESG